MQTRRIAVLALALAAATAANAFAVRAQPTYNVQRYGQPVPVTYFVTDPFAINTATVIAIPWGTTAGTPLWLGTAWRIVYTVNAVPAKFTDPDTGVFLLPITVKFESHGALPESPHYTAVIQVRLMGNVNTMGGPEGAPDWWLSAEPPCEGEVTP